MAVKEGFKVLSKDGKRLRGAVYSHVCYRKRGRTLPLKGEGPLCVFKDVFSAHGFRRNEGPELVIYAVRYETSRAKHVWKRYASGRLRKTPLCNLAPGKDLARWVELIKEIQ